VSPNRYRYVTATTFACIPLWESTAHSFSILYGLRKAIEPPKH